MVPIGEKRLQKIVEEVRGERLPVRVHEEDDFWEDKKVKSYTVTLAKSDSYGVHVEVRKNRAKAQFGINQYHSSLDRWSPQELRRLAQRLTEAADILERVNGI